MLELKNVAKKYSQKTILNKLNLQIKPGEIITIIGDSGIGKSTLLKCINRLEKINAGEIILDGVNTEELPISELRQQIGLVFQEFNLFEHLTVKENIMLGLEKVKKHSYKEALKITKRILKQVGLLDKIDYYPEQLSGGQKQRVAIARTIALKPKVIMFDEPTSALDKTMKNEIFSLIKVLKKENIAMLIVTHEEEYARKVSDYVFRLTRGKLIVSEEKAKC